MKKDFYDMKSAVSSLENGKFFFLMSLAYFNAAKVMAINIMEYEEVFNRSHAWVIEKVYELENFVATEKEKYGDYITGDNMKRVMAFFNEWPDGMCLDMEGVFSQVHGPLAQLLSGYAAFFWNICASVESYLNLEVARLVNSKKLREDAAQKIYGNNGKKAVVAFLKKIGRDLEGEFASALEDYGDAVLIRNKFSHYHGVPASFSMKEIHPGSIVGHPSLSPKECWKYVKAAGGVIDLIGGAYRVESKSISREIISFEPLSSPSPYFQTFDFE